MPEDLPALRAHLRSIGQLNAVITAMRGIAAAHAQQSRLLLPGMQAYAAMVSKAIAQALRFLDGMATRHRVAGKVIRIIFCPEQGFVGGLADHILSVAMARGAADLFLVGSRGLLQASAAGIVPIWSSTMATQAGSIAGLCVRLAEALYAHVASRSVGSVDVVFASWNGNAGIEVTCRSLLPLDPRGFPGAAGSTPPLATVPPDELLASLADEYVFASLCEVAMHAFVAENEARAAAMLRARRKVQDMLAELTLSEQRVRQEAITSELIELAAGT